MLTANFTITQGSDYSKATITDTTDYTNEPIAGMTSRSVVVYKSDGTELGTYTFSGTNLTTEITGLTKDLAVQAVFTITPATPDNNSTYTKTIYKALNGYGMAGYYSRHQKMSLNLRLEQNRDYVTDNYKLWMDNKAAEFAAAAEDVVSAQLALDRMKRIIDLNKIPY